MARAPYFAQYMRSLVEEYPNATQALRAWRAAGGKVRTQDFYRAYAEAQAQIALAPGELGADLQSVPEESEIAQGTFPHARGIAHEVVVIGRSRSGEILPKRVEIPTGDTPIERLAAIQRAEEWAQGFLSSEAPKNTDIVTVYGAVHVGVIRRLAPE